VLVALVRTIHCPKAVPLSSRERNIVLDTSVRLAEHESPKRVFWADVEAVYDDATQSGRNY
jgi:hypothetical protein